MLSIRWEDSPYSTILHLLVVYDFGWVHVCIIDAAFALLMREGVGYNLKFIDDVLIATNYEGFRSRSITIGHISARIYESFQERRSYSRRAWARKGTGESLNNDQSQCQTESPNRLHSLVFPMRVQWFTWYVKTGKSLCPVATGWNHYCSMHTRAEKTK